MYFGNVKERCKVLVAKLLHGVKFKRYVPFGASFASFWRHSRVTALHMY